MAEPPQAPPTITVIGEALIDLSPSGPPDNYHARPGGSPYNVAIGLSRLGQRPSLMARLSDDAFGRILRAHATAEGVDLEAAPTAAEPTTVALVSVDDHAQARYTFYRSGTADWQWTRDEIHRAPPATSVLHFGSIASWTSPAAELIHELATGFATRGDVLVTYDPNVRPALLADATVGRMWVERSVGVAAVVKASRDDIEWLYPGSQPKEVCARWLALGSRLVVITDGADGAYAFTAGGREVRRPGRPIVLVDTVGAGDAFTAALLDGLVRRGLTNAGVLVECTDKQLVDMLDEAILVSALACTRAGADPPTKAEISAITAGLSPSQAAG